jgi:hypothetical protein
MQVPWTRPTSPRQLLMPLDSTRLRGMSPSERQQAMTRLALLLTEAAGDATSEGKMMDGDILSLAILQRKAVVYVRQSGSRDGGDHRLQEPTLSRMTFQEVGSSVTERLPVNVDPNYA